MKALLTAIAFLSSLHAAASTPVRIPLQVSIDVNGDFDAYGVFSGEFVASGIIDAEGSVVDSPRFPGSAAHITRTMLTSNGEYLVFDIDTTRSSEALALSNSCAPPQAVASGTVLLPESGTWNLVSGTGKYANLQRSGSWSSYVVLDLELGVPVSATECMQRIDRVGLAEERGHK